MQAPLVGMFGALMKDWIPLIDEYYYCKYSNVECWASADYLSRYRSLGDAACVVISYPFLLHLYYSGDFWEHF